jgi:hypothetical protein
MDQRFCAFSDVSDEAVFESQQAHRLSSHKPFVVSQSLQLNVGIVPTLASYRTAVLSWR